MTSRLQPARRDFARSLRGSMTDAEQLLWKRLRAYRLLGEKFRRQAPLGKYIVDFVHYGAKLVIEVDGGQHLENVKDLVRDAWLSSERFRVLRFWNDDVLLRADDVLEEIIRTFPPLPNPSPTRGEGLTAKRMKPVPLPPRGGGARGEGEGST